ncbi:hypothetical protein GJ496_006588 [Pomphorhynchus laevis]|nr:hypothetical protein GJ496_008706 [Pomphorhynchus laevis]KAI0985547.1 hypothetical protein GJ496_006588 [Pomphorhynchus laevis]
MRICKRFDSQELLNLECENKDLTEEIINLRDRIKLTRDGFALRYDKIIELVLDLIRTRFNSTINIDICDLAKTLINLCSDANTTGTDHITLDCPASLRSCLEQLCCPWTQTEIVDQTNVDNEGEQSLNKDFKVNENLRNRCCLSDGSSTRLDQLLKQLMIHRDRMNSKLNLSLDQGRILS